MTTASVEGSVIKKPSNNEASASKRDLSPPRWPVRPVSSCPVLQLPDDKVQLVDLYMDLTLLLAGKGCLAQIALVNLLPSVDFHVDRQLAVLEKGLVAQFALVWPLVRVDSTVSMQLAGVLERLLPYGAGV